MSVSSDLILVLNQEAIQRKSDGQHVINGTIGSMFTDEGLLPIQQYLRSILAKHTNDADLCYSSVSGEDSFARLSLDWFFGGFFDNLAKDGRLRCLGTMGGTGACAASIKAASKDGSVLLIPSLAWPNYQSIAFEYGTPFLFYNLVKSESLDLGGLEKQIFQLTAEHRNIALIVNDPCENPTGYSMNAKEWARLVDILNKAAKIVSVSLIADCAYIDYGKVDSKSIIAQSIKKLKGATASYLCLSFSKTLSFYGLRVGALAICSNTQIQTSFLYDDCIGFARAMWSVPNHMGINAVSEILSDEKAKSELIATIAGNKALLKKRADVFLSESNACQLRHYPYESGFFVSLPCDGKAIEAASLLRDKNIFVAPLSPDVIRVSLGCITTDEIQGLAVSIKQTLK
jgi:aspartate/tyrosine/aromatic aminotransferase